MAEWFASLKDEFILNFIDDDRWLRLLKGLGITLEITFFSVLIGIVLGVIVAAIRSTYDNTPNVKKKKDASAFLLKFLNLLSNFYLTVIRGTPVVVQLLIGYYVIFAASNNKILVASLVFGINSGAYLAEIFRSGINSIDKGQMEAGRSLGFNYPKTMIYIIIPQAFKNVLPSIANEFIVLLKETSVAGYVALEDLTKAADIIRGRTFSAFMPLFAIAIIYLAVVMILTWLVKKLERRLKNSER